jgi:hypothetical protein
MSSIRLDPVDLGAQITRSGAAMPGTLAALVADQNGGSRAMTVTSDRHGARLAFQSADEPSAEYSRLRLPSH